MAQIVKKYENNEKQNKIRLMRKKNRKCPEAKGTIFVDFPVISLLFYITPTCNLDILKYNRHFKQCTHFVKEGELLVDLSETRIIYFFDRKQNIVKCTKKQCNYITNDINIQQTVKDKHFSM